MMYESTPNLRNRLEICAAKRVLAHSSSALAKKNAAVLVFAWSFAWSYVGAFSARHERASSSASSHARRVVLNTIRERLCRSANAAAARHASIAGLVASLNSADAAADAADAAATWDTMAGVRAALVAREPGFIASALSVCFAKAEAHLVAVDGALAHVDDAASALSAIAAMVAAASASVSLRALDATEKALEKEDTRMRVCVEWIRRGPAAAAVLLSTTLSTTLSTDSAGFCNALQAALSAVDASALVALSYHPLFSVAAASTAALCDQWSDAMLAAMRDMHTHVNDAEGAKAFVIEVEHLTRTRRLRFSESFFWALVLRAVFGFNGNVDDAAETADAEDADAALTPWFDVDFALKVSRLVQVISQIPEKQVCFAGHILRAAANWRRRQGARRELAAYLAGIWPPPLSVQPQQ